MIFNQTNKNQGNVYNLYPRRNPMNREKFGTVAHDEAFLHDFVEAGCKAGDVEKAVNLGLTWAQIIQLIFKYGQVLFQVCSELYGLIKSNNLSAASIQALVQKYGPQVEAMVREILALIGLPVPTV